MGWPPLTALYVRRRKEAEQDPFGAVSDGGWGEPEEVPGCLIAPGAPQGIADARPDGAEVDATAFFPRGWPGSLRGAQVSSDGDRWYDVMGDPLPYTALPPDARWDRYAYLRLTEG